MGAEQLLFMLEPEKSLPPADFDPLQGKVHRGNLYRNGVYQTSGLAKLKGIKWKFKTGGEVRSSPVLVDGIIYIGSYDGYVYAIDADTGLEKWKYKTAEKVSGSAAVVDGVVYIAGEDGRLYALKADDGTLVWKTPRMGRGRPAGSPAVFGNMVIIGSGGKGGSEVLGGGGGPMYAFDRTSGKKTSTYSRGPNGYCAIACDGEYIYANYTSYNIATGQLKYQWKSSGHNAQNRPFMSTTLAGGSAYVCGTIRGSIGCIAAKRGDNWENATLDGQMQKNMDDGAKFGYEIFTDLTVAFDTVYAGCNDGKFYTFATKDGKKGWNFDAGSKIQSSPSIAGEIIYFGSWGGHVYALNAKTGEFVWKQKLGGRIISSPRPGNGVIFVGCDDGFVYALH